MQYYTTASQEAVFEIKLDETISALDFNGKSDICKIQAVYDYVCDNVMYDASSDIGLSAYGALVNGKATCQGYSLLLMRMLEKAGLEAHVVFGKTGKINHMWNTVKLADSYYLLDSTWDSQSQTGCYFWFLKGSNSFDDHLAECDPAYTISDVDHPAALVYSHVFDDDCDTACNVCGYTRTITHNYQTEWTKNSEKHWHECSACGGKSEISAHELDWIIDKQATVTEAGAKHEECKICGYKKLDVAIDKLAPAITDGKDAKWNKGSECGLVFRSDAAISDFVEVLVDGSVVAPENYDKREGSIIIKLKASYVETLPEGKHVLTIRSTSGDANTDFSVEEAIVTPTTGAINA